MTRLDHFLPQLEKDRASLDRSEDRYGEKEESLPYSMEWVGMARCSSGHSTCLVCTQNRTDQKQMGTGDWHSVWKNQER